MNRKTRTLAEGSIMVALSLVLEMITLYKLPNGGSVTLSMVPIILFAVRHGSGWGTMAGGIFGCLNYIFGGTAIDWTTIICDYLIAFSMLGFGAGLFHRRKYGCVWGSFTGLTLQFTASYLVGVFVWGKWMPEDFLGMTMTTPWIYSFFYNILWAGPDLLLSVAVFVVLYQLRPLQKHLLGQDLR